MTDDINMGGQMGNDSTNREYHRTSKSRVHWTIPRCIRDEKCKNYPDGCEACLRYSNWEEKV